MEKTAHPPMGRIVTKTLTGASIRRLPFLFSVVLVGIGIYVDLRLEETPAFAHAQKQTARPSGSPGLKALREHPRVIMLAAGAFMAVNHLSATRSARSAAVPLRPSPRQACSLPRELRWRSVSTCA
jgi:hypothetical protein